MAVPDEIAEQEHLHCACVDADGCAVTVYDVPDSEAVRIQERDGETVMFARVVVDTSAELDGLIETLQAVREGQE